MMAASHAGTHVAAVSVPFPAATFYNIRYTGRSHSEKLQQRQDNLKWLTARYPIICLSELHASEAVATSCLFDHLPSHRSYCHCGSTLPGQAILVERKWADSKGIGYETTKGVEWDHEVAVEGSMHVLWWIDGDVVRGILNLYLNANSARVRASQLQEATKWFTNFRQRHEQTDTGRNDRHVELIFGGDRNLISDPEHRTNTQRDGPWHPGREVLQSWDLFLGSLGQAVVALSRTSLGTNCTRPVTAPSSLAEKSLMLQEPQSKASATLT